MRWGTKGVTADTRFNRPMPFYIRKSVSVGPFRLNFSKGGVGASVGVKGFRVGTGPRGHYVHAGAGGLYYRSSIGRAGERPARGIAPQASQSAYLDHVTVDGIVMREVESGDVLMMRDATVKDLLDDINEKASKTPLAPLMGWGGGILGLGLLLAHPSIGIVVLGMALIAWMFVRWIESYQRKAVLFYEMEPEAERSFTELTAAFDVLAACGGKWHVAAGGAVQDLTQWKRNAGASHVVKKAPTTLAYALPGLVSSNLTPPSVKVGAQTLYFFPDVVLVEHGKSFGAVGYASLDLRWQDSNFIEEGTVPADALVIGQTWKHPNKSGGPDRRFRDNYQIPICRYEAFHIRSPSGLNELLEFSRTGVVAPFIDAARKLATAVSAARSDKKMHRLST